ncbi:MAG: C4-dicarboxylate TRAP transporter substrate-binding protein [Pseudolabrys sp.]
MLNCRALLSRHIGGIGLALAIAAIPLTANAQQVIKLTAIDAYPPKALWVEVFIKYFIPEVDKRLAKDGKYKIEWQQSWSGQIAKPRGVLDAIKGKLGDIGIVTTVFHSSKLPLNNLPYYTPFSSRNPIVVSRVMDELMEKFPAFQKQFDDQNQIVLTNFSSIDNYGIFTKAPVTKMEDLKGMKLNAAGANALYVKPLGAVGVLGSLVTYYNQVKTGATDGVIIWPEAAITFKFAELTQHYFETDFGTGVNKSVTINKDVWNSLPPDVKKVLKEVAVAYRDEVGKQALAEADDAVKQFKKLGGKVTSLSEADKKKWANMMPNIAMDLADDVEKKNGYPAKQILSAYMDALRKAGEKPVRDWDKK